MKLRYDKLDDSENQVESKQGREDLDTFKELL